MLRAEMPWVDAARKDIYAKNEQICRYPSTSERRTKRRVRILGVQAVSSNKIGWSFLLSSNKTMVRNKYRST